MYAYVYLRRLYPKEIKRIENFQTFFGQPKSKASRCFWGRYRLQKEIVSFVHLKGKNVFKIVSFSSMLKIEKNCIPSMKNKKNLHSQCQKFFKNAFPVPKIKKICIPSAKNEKKYIANAKNAKNLYCKCMN